MKKQTKILLIIISIILLILILSGGYLLMQSLKDIGSEQIDPTIEKQSREIGELDLIRRKAIQQVYPDFTVDYEDQQCFAGCSVKVLEDARDYFYAYITHASGLPIGIATCFKVDPMMRVYKVGEFPDMTDSYIGYKDVDPKTCKGIK